ncbi:MAG: hypothetical protein AB2563_03325, partial [Candidatus Thiodiazotropha endolucinida]
NEFWHLTLPFVFFIVYQITCKKGFFLQPQRQAYGATRRTAVRRPSKLKANDMMRLLYLLFVITNSTL